MVEAKRPAPVEGATSPTAPNKKPNISWAWLWKNVTFSDIKIVLVADGTAHTQSRTASASAGHTADVAKAEGNGTQAAEPAGPDGQKQVVLQELPAHKVVVASVSNYFRDRLVAWDQQQQQQNPATPAPCVLEETILPDQLTAADAVFQFMYNQELPKPINTMQLITVARLAERWDMPACTQACLQALSALTPQQLPASLIGSIMADDLPKSVVDQPQYTPLLDACKQRMIQLFGSVQTVITNDSLRQSFCELPFSAVKLWARMDELRVDNENSVAVILALWWLHNHPGTVRSPTAAGTSRSAGGAAAGDTEALKEQRLVISGLVRLNQLSASFFTGVLQTLPWWGPNPDIFNMLLMARALHSSKGALLQQPIRDRFPGPWLAKARARDMNQEVTHEWVVGKELFEALHKEAGAGRTLKESPGLYWSGYTWCLCLSLNSQKDALWVGVRAKSAAPQAYSVPALMEAKFHISVKEASTKEYTKKESLNFGDGAALQPANCNGTPRLLAVPATATPRAATLPPANLMLDGKVYLQLTMEGMQ